MLIHLHVYYEDIIYYSLLMLPRPVEVITSYLPFRVISGIAVQNTASN